jgi:hypothetical protein
MVFKILLILLALIALFLIVAAFQPSEFRITRSGLIAAPPPVVFGHVNDLRKWEAWSPWAKLDPAMKQAYDGPASGVGAVSAWAGNKQVGEGKMSIMESRPFDLIRIQLEFYKPMAATHETEFHFAPEGDQTRVIWSMTGRRNFMMKAFGLLMNMDKRVGRQLEEGLSRLNAVAHNPDS